MLPKVKLEWMPNAAYKTTWDYQEALLGKAVALKTAKKNNPEQEIALPENVLIFCEHPHVYTLGKSGDANNLLINEAFLAKINATYFPINRGGDITYHGPGQLVVYPIFDLEQFFTDIHKYMRALEEVIIRVLAHYGLKGDRYAGLTGVWLDVNDPKKARKICAMGVKTSRWVTMHGLAFNINTDLKYFEYIVPCGITDKQVTSLERELGHPVAMDEVRLLTAQYFKEIFDFEYQ